jgi:hypothetical protein
MRTLASSVRGHVRQTGRVGDEPAHVLEELVVADLVLGFVGVPVPSGCTLRHSPSAPVRASADTRDLLPCRQAARDLTVEVTDCSQLRH